MDKASQRTDPLKTAATSPGALRPRFRERQVLRAADLEAEQSYLIEARRRHNIGQHGWGIVQGLEIVDTPELMVQPGVAVDGYGRELIVPAPVNIPNSVFDEFEEKVFELGDKTLDVWLFYELVEANVPQHGNWSCGPGTNSRTREQTRLRLTPAKKGEQRLPTEVPRRPFEVPSSDLPFPAHRPPPDDPASEWPVYLGTIKLTEPQYYPNSPRPFATLTGEMVTATSGLARMQVGSELQSDTRRFAVTVPDTAGKFIERVGIDREGDTFLNGKTTVTNSQSEPNTSKLRLRVGPARLLNFKRLAATPAAAAPWQIYRTSVKEAQRTIEQLRFEIGHPGDKGDPGICRLAIGKRDATGNFLPCFSVSADCTVTIEGDVTVAGQLIKGAVKADASDPRFTALLAQTWVEGTKVGEKTATTGTIQGTVKAKAGPVIPRADVELTNLGIARSSPADENGRFVAADIPIGTYSIKAEAPGFQAKTIESLLSASETRNVTITLDPVVITPPPASGTIVGTVVDSAGATIPDARVEFTNLGTGVIRTIQTNEEGAFLMTPLPVGTYRIRVVKSNFIPQEQEHTLAGGQTLSIRLEIEAVIPP